MVVVMTLVILFLIFFFIRRHVGPAHLAMIAGLSVYASFGDTFAEFLVRVFNMVSLDLMQTIVYLMLVAGFPLLLYFNSSKGGLYGPLRIIEAGIAAILLTVVLAPTIAQFATFDALATDVANWLVSIEGPVLMTGVILAYFDIVVYHE